MSLKGNLKTMSLPDLLGFIAFKRGTGTLELVRGSFWKRLYFEKGRIISAGSSQPEEYLGHFLIAENMISEEQLSEAMKVQQKTQVMLGKILVMIGAVEEAEMVRLLEMKCKETIYGMFLWEDADFEFKDNELPAVRLIPVSLDLDPLIEEGDRRKEKWKMLRRAYPSRQIRFARTGGAMDGTGVTDPLEKSVYELIDGERTVADIVMALHTTDFRVLTAIDQLKNRGNIHVVSYGQTEESPQYLTIAPVQMLEIGRNKLAFGKYEEAINLFNYVLLHEEQNPEAKELLDNAENALVRAIYDEIISPDAIPKLSNSSGSIGQERLSSEESFLVARINGRWDLRSILTITPLREVDALRAMKRLIERKLVET